MSHLHAMLVASGRCSGSDADLHICRQRFGSMGGIIVGIFKLMQDSGVCTYCSVGTGNRMLRWSSECGEWRRWKVEM